ncbi:hypothetical protein XENTR_v10011318 [Xenopus tropicalis]|nr:hypothetical protein XENTR_v10011318 [Xenopus tropicalis]
MEPSEIVLMKPVQMKMKTKSEDLVVVLTPWRAFLLYLEHPLRVQTTFSYLEISDIDIQDPSLVVIHTDPCLYQFRFMSSEDLEQVIFHVATSIKKVFPDSSPGKLIRMTCADHEEKYKRIEDSLENITQNNQGPCGGFSQTYAALCDYNGFVLREEVQWDVDNIYHRQNIREFNILDFSHLDTTDIALTVASLSFNQWFTKIHCRDFKLRLEISEQILYVINRSLKLEEIVLENCGLKCEFAIKMAKALDNNPGSVLHTFNLSGNNIDDRGINAFTQYFNKNHKPVKHLNISKTSITSKGVNSLFQSFVSHETFANSICHLDLSGNPGILATEDAISFYNFLDNCKSLCHLNLAGTDCALDSLFGPLLHGSCSRLSYLNVSRNVYTHKKIKDIPPEVSQFFSKTLALKHLNLSGTKIPSEMLREILHGLSTNDKIRNLHMDLSDCELRSSGAQVIQDMIFDINSLSSLDLSNNGFDSDMVTLILSVGRSKSIKHVSLGKNFNIKSGTAVADIIHRIVQLIQDEDCTIESLSLADSRLKSEINILLNALGKKNNLRKIDISGNGMGDSGAKHLAKALQLNTQLRMITWDKNNTTANGFLTLGHALERNYTLRFMPLPLSDISQAYRMNQSKTEDALHLIQSYLLRNNHIKENVVRKVNGLHKEIASTLPLKVIKIKELTKIIVTMFKIKTKIFLLKGFVTWD